MRSFPRDFPFFGRRSGSRQAKRSQCDTPDGLIHFVRLTAWIGFFTFFYHSGREKSLSSALKGATRSGGTRGNPDGLSVGFGVPEN
jgi:hypothetical protein